MILDALGLKGTGGHTPEETANLETLPTQTKRAAVLIYRLLSCWTILPIGLICWTAQKTPATPVLSGAPAA